MVALVALQDAKADTSEWSVATSGVWTNPACWVGAIVPTNTSAYTNDIFVNVSGTYTSQWINNLQRIEAGAITVGTTTGSGTQTVLISGYAYQVADVDGSITVGSLGVLDLKQSLNDLLSNSVAGIVINTGGGMRMSQPDPGYGRTWAIGANRLLSVAPGAWLDIQTNCALKLGGLQSGTHTNNGVISGPGNFIVNGGAYVGLSGSGLLDGPGIINIPYNAHLNFGGTLTNNRNFVQTDANLGEFNVLDAANLTMNGSITCTNAGSYFYSATDTPSQVGGSGSIDISFVAGQTNYLGGGAWNVRRGMMTLYGSGQLILRTQNSVVDNHFSSLVLARATYVNDAGGKFRINNGVTAVLSNNTGILTLAQGTRVQAGANDASRLRIRAGAGVVLNGAAMEGYSTASDHYAFNFSDDNSAATLVLSAGTTNTLAGLASSQMCWARLGTNAVASVGVSSVFSVSNAVLHVTMTNSSQWGWSSQGTVKFGSNVVMEALGTDHSYHVDINNEPFSINRLAFDTANTTLTLTNSVGSTKRALYVKTLDLSAMPGGTLDLQGFSGAERIYYANLVNPNNVTFVTPAEWVMIPVQGTMVILM